MNHVSAQIDPAKNVLVRWTGGNPAATPGCRLACFPYAGGAAQIYRTWAAPLACETQLFAVEYPGRGRRRSTPMPTRLSDLAVEAADALSAVTQTPLVLFGHSMGALVAYEVAQRLSRLGQPPNGLIISAHRAPHFPRAEPTAHLLPDRQFIEYLRSLNGTPAEILTNPEILSIVLPVLRSDLRLCAEYSPTVSSPLACPICVLGGLDDKMANRASLDAWSGYTKSRFEAHLFPGGHFFPFDGRDVFLPSIARLISQYSSDRSGAPVI